MATWMSMQDLMKLRISDDHLVHPELLASMATHGQLVPVLVSTAYGICQGAHRIAIARALAWPGMEVTSDVAEHNHLDQLHAGWEARQVNDAPS
jgi:ParB-like chromosome segregation protein Spo0J